LKGKSTSFGRQEKIKAITKKRPTLLRPVGWAFALQIHLGLLLGSYSEPTTGGVNITAAKSRLANSHFEAVAILAQGATFGSGELTAASGAAP
jgi:hypothetical protein